MGHAGVRTRVVSASERRRQTHRLMTRALILLAFAPFALAGCAATVGAGHDSPWEGRVELRFAPRMPLGQSERTEFRPTVAYERAFSGGGANLLHAGGQIRFEPSFLQNHPGFWIGGEGLYVARFPRPISSGRFGAIFGYPLLEGERVTTHLVGAAGLTTQRGGTGAYVRFGLEFNPTGR
jgi:hypothetical protein